MSSITGSGQFHDPAYLYGDGVGQYFESIQVGDKIVLSDLGTDTKTHTASSRMYRTARIISTTRWEDSRDSK
jgi:hypothetical protein